MIAKDTEKVFERLIRFYFREKLFEWIMMLNVCILGWGALLSPDGFQQSAFRYMIFVSDARWFGILCVALCYARLIALVVNGRSHYYGPHTRVACAIVSSLIWFQMFTALAEYSITHGYFSPGLSNWFSLCVGEIIAAYLAGQDVRRSA